MAQNNFSDRMNLFMIVNDPEIATFVADHGVTRLFVDLEYMGKDIRQKGDTWKSRHTLDDVAIIRNAAPQAHLMVRVNPLHNATANEVDNVLARGADSIMLPMFHSSDDLSRFFDIVNNRAEIVPLIETHSALLDVPKMVKKLPLTQVHFGLNDLHLDMGLMFMFQLIADGTLEPAAAALRAAHIPFGIGGIAQVDDGGISPRYLLGEHVRLGSSSAILSRGFHKGAPSLDVLKASVNFAQEIEKLNAIYNEFKQSDAEILEKNRIATSQRIAKAVTKIAAQRQV